ncbi:MAG: SCO family protein, partial [Gemmatimonadales bacterium]
MTPRRLAGLLLSAVILGCARGPQGSDFHGIVLPVAFARPHATLTATDGKPFSFYDETKGHITFLFFGYTHCPAVCPVHMANLAAVLKHFT